MAWKNHCHGKMNIDIFPMHCGVERLFFSINCFVKIYFGLEIQFLLKCLFLTVFSKIYRPTKVDMLGAWEVSISLRNSWRFFIPGYPKVTHYVLKMAAKLTSLVLIRKLGISVTKL